MTDKPTSSIRALDKLFLSGLAWTFGGTWSVQLVTWGSVFILARLLSPAEFGLAAMSGLYNVITNVLAEFGIASAVLQMRELPKQVREQLHVAAVILCTILALVSIALSPLIAEFFGAHEVKWLIIVNSASLVITGFNSVPLAELRKRLDYRHLAIIDAAQVSVRAVVSVLAALAGASYWSTVIGGLCGKAVATFLLERWAGCGYRWPRLKEIKQPLSFGGRVTVSSLTSTLLRESDGVVVANQLGERALGVYMLAVQLARMPTERITSLLMRVSSPLFAGVQNDRTMTTRYYLRIMESLGMGLIPLTVGLAIVAPEAVAIALGSQWADAVPVVRIFVLATLFQAVNALNSQVLLPLREVKFVMWINIVSLVVIPVVCLAVSPFGIAAIASVWLASSPTVALLTTARLRKGISLEWLQIARALAPSIVGGSVMAILLAWLMLQKWFPSENHIYLRLTLIVVAGGIVYTGTLLVFFRNVMSRYFHFLRAAAKGNSSQLMAND